MSGPPVQPGPDAQRAFRLGTIAATLVALASLASLYWAGHLSLSVVGFGLVIGLPVYLILVASLLSVWLGFDKDATDLRPVYRERERS